MKIDKQSNLYTIIYIVILVAVVGTALAFTSMSLKSRQQANADAAKMKQILASVRVTVEPGNDVKTVFDEIIVDQPVFNARGERVDGETAFDIDVMQQSQLPDAKRLLPVYVARLRDGSTKFIVPMHGNGLWGPIWGYIAFNADEKSTVYCAFFDHQSETPGLGAEITKPQFCDQFTGKSPYSAQGTFMGIAVVKKGMKAPQGEEFVDAISGGTITSKGVDAMLNNCLKPYEPILRELTATLSNPNMINTDNDAAKAASEEGRNNG